MKTNTMVPNLRSVLIAAGLASTALLTACVDYPHNNSEYGWHEIDEVDFSGWAEFPDSTIHMEAYDYSTSSWEVVEQFESGAHSQSAGGEIMYRWRLNDFDFTSIPDWHCYWDPSGSCDPNENGFAKQVRVRFIEPASGTPTGHMVTFDKGGVSCVVDAVIAGNPWSGAGFNCRSGSSPTLTLRIIN